MARERPSNIYEHMQELERVEFKKKGLDNAITDLQICKSDRINSSFDTRYEIGYRILTHDLAHGVKGDRAGKDRVFINFTEENLSYKASELKAADVQISLQNDNNIIPFVQELAEGTLNHTFDYIDTLQKTYRIIEDQNFFNWGVCYTGWDGYDQGSGMWTVGKPYVEVCEPNSIYINPGVHDDLYEDLEQIFEEKKYNTERAKLLYPDVAEKIQETSVRIGDKEEEQTGKKNTQIIRYQYRKSYIFEQRKIINNERDVEVGVTDWLEEDYQEYLQERLVEIKKNKQFEELVTNIKGMLEDEDLRGEFRYLDEIEDVLEKRKKNWEIEFIDLIAQQDFDNLIFEEKILATKKRNVEYRAWFEVIFCESLDILLQEPNIKKRCGYAIFPGSRDPKNSYPISQAYKSSKILEMHSAALTLQMLYIIKMGKPQIVIEEGAIVNDEDFRKSGYDPAFKIIVDSTWRRKNPLPAKPFFYVDPPDLNPAIMALDKKLEMWIEKQDRSHPVTKGQPSSPDQSGIAIMSLQQASKQGDKSDLYKLAHFYKVICENLKDLIMEMLGDIPFKILHLDQNGDEKLIEINSGDDNTISNIGDDCYVRIDMNDNVETAMNKNRLEADYLLKNQLITKIDALKLIKPIGLERIIKNLKKQDETLQMMSMIESNPEVKEEIMQILRQTQEGNPQGTEQPEKSDIKRKEVAA